jgi:uncharacterized tellurite resistance protein B-like protein
MLDIIKKYFGASEDSGGTGEPSRHDTRIATCALFLEMANLDDQFSGTERSDVVDILKGHYQLSAEEADELTRVAEAQLDGSVDLWHFTNLINKHYSREEKLDIVQLMWRLIYVDGRLSDHERYLARKLGKMLRLTHRELINAKLAVLNERNDRT